MSSRGRDCRGADRRAVATVGDEDGIAALGVGDVGDRKKAAAVVFLLWKGVGVAAAASHGPV